MTFYERYVAICTDRQLEPCSQKAANAFGVTRATISAWNKKDTMPNGETVRVIADTLGVSCDYLLGRTDDPTDYSSLDFIHTSANLDMKKEKEQVPEILNMFNQLDSSDKPKVKGIIQGLLLQDKYQTKQKLG